MKELFYPSTYHAMKAGPCRFGVCKYDGKCGLCEEYGALRRYAARDTDRIHELRALVKEMEDEKRISDAVIQSLRDKKLEIAGEIAAKEAEVSALRALVKEIADVLNNTNNYMCFHCTVRNCPGENECRDTKKYCLLIAKAGEVIGGAE